MTLEDKTDYKHSQEFRDTEKEERAYRRPNLIVRGLAEPAGVSEKDKYENYLVSVQDLVKAVGVREEVYH